MNDNTPKVGDYVRLKGFERAYIPPEPCGILVHNGDADDSYPYGIIFDDDVLFRPEGNPPAKPKYGFSVHNFQLIHRECLADSPWIANVATDG